MTKHLKTMGMSVIGFVPFHMHTRFAREKRMGLDAMLDLFLELRGWACPENGRVTRKHRGKDTTRRRAIVSLHGLMPHHRTEAKKSG